MRAREEVQQKGTPKPERDKLIERAKAGEKVSMAGQSSPVVIGDR